MRCPSSAALLTLLLVTAAPAAADILDDDSAVSFTIEAPFDDLLAHADAEDYRIVGRLLYDDPSSGRRVRVDQLGITLRGNTSRRASECDFPKLRLDFTDADGTDTDSTAFEGLTALKIGTHCADRSDTDLTPKYGRLANERAPHREALVYAMVRAAGVPTLRSRPARLTYVWTDRPGSSPLTRNALLLEDDDEAARRFEATGDVEEEQFTSAADQFDPADTASLALAQALIGNFDWCLRLFMGDVYRCNTRHPLWNVLALEREGKRTLPVIYDFDLAGPVVGRHIWFRQVFDTAFAPSGSATEVEVVAQVQRTRSLFPRSLLDSTRRQFMARRDRIYAAIDRGVVDDQGRLLAHRYADAFFAAIQDERFYGPVTIEGGAVPFLDAAGTQPACPGGPPVPAGTPVGEPIERSGTLVRVRLLDVLWQWTGDRRCDTVHREAVWLPADVVGHDYPR